MIIKLKPNGTLEVLPQAVPEFSENILIEYIMPKGLNHLQAVLQWGTDKFIGNNIRITKNPTNLFPFKVTLYDGDDIYKTYTLQENQIAHTYIGYNILKLHPNIIKYVEDLEKENKELRERGDVI